MTLTSIATSSLCVIFPLMPHPLVLIIVHGLCRRYRFVSKALRYHHQISKCSSFLSTEVHEQGISRLTIHLSSIEHCFCSEICLYKRHIHTRDISSWVGVLLPAGEAIRSISLRTSQEDARLCCWSERSTINTKGEFKWMPCELTVHEVSERLIRLLD